MSLRSLTSFGRSAQRLVLTVGLVAKLGSFGCGSPISPGTTAPPAVPPAPNVVPSDEAAWRRTPPNPGPPGHFSYPIPVVTKLDNGLSLYVLERSNGPVVLSVVISKGASSEPSKKSGLASLTAELMAEATKHHSHLALSEAAESLGSNLKSDANRDYLHVSIDTLPEDVQAGLTLLAETLTEPAFDEEDFSRLQKQKLDDLRAERQNPTRLASLVGLETLLGPNLGNPVGGCPQSVKALRLTDVKKWHQEAVHPANAALFVVGPITTLRVKQLAEQTFGRWNNQKPTPRTVTAIPMPPKGRTVYLLDRPGSVQSSLFVVQSFPKRQAEGFIAREHLDNILGGLFTSRINQNLRETHAYTYGARTAVIAARDFGLFTCSTSVATDVTAPALSEVFNELIAIRGPTARSPIQSAELQRSRADLVQSLGAHLEDNHRLVNDLEQLFVYDLPNGYFAEYPERVKNTTESDVLARNRTIRPRANASGRRRRRLCPEARTRKIRVHRSNGFHHVPR